MRTSRHLGILALAATVGLGCSTVGKINSTIDKAGKAADSVSQLAKNLNETITQLKSQAKTPATAAPVSQASVPTLPAQATGNVDVTKPVAAKTGSGSADVDGSGTPEMVQVFVADMSTVTMNSIHPLGITTSDEATTFLAWKGDAESGDDGQCYLGWEHAGKAWFIISACGASTGQVCGDDGDTATCAACNEAGSCTSCDTSQPLSACTAPSEGADAGTQDDATATDPDAG